MWMSRIGQRQRVSSHTREGDGLVGEVAAGDVVEVEVLENFNGGRSACRNGSSGSVQGGVVGVTDLGHATPLCVEGGVGGEGHDIVCCEAGARAICLGVPTSEDKTIVRESISLHGMIGG